MIHFSRAFSIVRHAQEFGLRAETSQNIHRQVYDSGTYVLDSFIAKATAS